MHNNTSMDIGEYHQVGDYVVASYNEHGSKIKEGIVIGTEDDLAKATERISHSALARGSLLPPVTKVASTIQPARKGRRKIDVKTTTTKPVYIQPQNRSEPRHVSNSDNLRVVIPSMTVSNPTIPVVLPEAYKPIDIVFHNKFGKITLSVESYIEDTFAVCLVFRNEKEVRFIPEQAEELDLILDKDKTFRVLSPGIIFTWIDGTRKLMILVKIPKDDYGTE